MVLSWHKVCNRSSAPTSYVTVINVDLIKDAEINPLLQLQLRGSCMAVWGVLVPGRPRFQFPLSHKLQGNIGPVTCWEGEEWEILLSEAPPSLS